MSPLKQRVTTFLESFNKHAKTDVVAFVSNNFWLTTNRFIGVGSGILLSVAFANLLPPYVFGTYKYVIAIAGFVTAFSLSGLSSALSRAVAQGQTRIIKEMFKKSVLWSIPASLCTLIVAGYYFYQGNVALGAGLTLIAICTPFANGFGLYKGVMQGRSDFKSMAIITMTRSLIPIVVIIGTMLITKDVVYILIAYFASSTLSGWWVYTAMLKRHATLPSPSAPATSAADDEKTAAETIHYSKHLSIVGLISQAASSIDQLLLWHFMGPIALATYTFASAPVRELRGLSENFFPIIFPKYAAKSMEEIKKSAPLRMKQMFVISATLAIIYILAAPFIFKYIFPQYTSAVFASQLLALALFIQPKGIIDTIMLAHGHVNSRYTLTLITNGVEIALFLLLIPKYGIMGAVAGTLASELVAAVVLLLTYRKF